MFKSMARKARTWLDRQRFRSWIRNELRNKGGKEYFELLEMDIGVEPGFFRKEARKSIFKE